MTQVVPAEVDLLEFGSIDASTGFRAFRLVTVPAPARPRLRCLPNGHPRGTGVAAALRNDSRAPVVLRASATGGRRPGPSADAGAPREGHPVIRDAPFHADVPALAETGRCGVRRTVITGHCRGPERGKRHRRVRRPPPRLSSSLRCSSQCSNTLPPERAPQESKSPRRRLRKSRLAPARSIPSPHWRSMDSRDMPDHLLSVRTLRSLTSCNMRWTWGRAAPSG